MQLSCSLAKYLPGNCCHFRITIYVCEKLAACSYFNALNASSRWLPHNRGVEYRGLFCIFGFTSPPSSASFAPAILARETTPTRCPTNTAAVTNSLHWLFYWFHSTCDIFMYASLTGAWHLWLYLSRSDENYNEWKIDLRQTPWSG